MTTQSFSLYTKNGYAGDLVDSAPAVKQTGILTSASVGFGKAVKRDTSVERGVAVGGAAKVFAITAREYNHEAGTRPSTGNDTFYLVTESVSLVREGYLYVLLGGAVAVSAGQVLHVDTVTGVFSKTAVAGNVVATTNVVAEEAGIAGDVIKVRIDI
jgi:hypothetical protein